MGFEDGIDDGPSEEELTELQDEDDQAVLDELDAEDQATADEEERARYEDDE